MQNGFCVRQTEAVDYLWVIFFCCGKYIVSCSRGWKKNSLSSYFNEVPNVILILLSRAPRTPRNSKPDCPSVRLQMMWKQATSVKGSLNRKIKNLYCRKEGQRCVVNRCFRLLKSFFYDCTPLINCQGGDELWLALTQNVFLSEKLVK